MEDIVQDAERARVFLGGLSLEEFIADERTLFAVERLLQRITDATIQIGADEMARILPELPARQRRDFDNMLQHQYADINEAVVYTIAKSDLPVLAAAAARALES